MAVEAAVITDGKCLNKQEKAADWPPFYFGLLEFCWLDDGRQGERLLAWDLWPDRSMTSRVEPGPVTSAAWILVRASRRVRGSWLGGTWAADYRDGRYILFVG